ncbi:MAG TPA: hypothetical protein VMV07_09955 [Streptosporangiaceae bacterium]|nr:hypothetical protein [Streptosporangiaceae bacterium]
MPALVNGAAGAVWAPGGRPCVVFTFTITTSGKITAIDLIADAERIGQFDLSILGDGDPGSSYPASSDRALKDPEGRP